MFVFLNNLNKILHEYFLSIYDPYSPLDKVIYFTMQT